MMPVDSLKHIGVVPPDMEPPTEAGLTEPLTATFLCVAPELVQVMFPLAGLDDKAAMRA